MENVLHVNTMLELSSNDCVIIIGGTNDTDPYQFEIALGNCLQTVSKTNIITLEVPFNKNLNETKFNYLVIIFI